MGNPGDLPGDQETCWDYCPSCGAAYPRGGACINDHPGPHNGKRPSPIGTRERNRIELRIRSGGRAFELEQEYESPQQLAAALERAALDFVAKIREGS